MTSDLGFDHCVNLVICEIDDHGICAQASFFHIREEFVECVLWVASDVLQFCALDDMVRTTRLGTLQYRRISSLPVACLSGDLGACDPRPTDFRLQVCSGRRVRPEGGSDLSHLSRAARGLHE
jgi:hypothetical protein